MSKKLYVLQVQPEGKILELDPDNGELRTLVDGLKTHPDGIALDRAANKLYVSFMGAEISPDSLEFFQADGRLESMTTEGTDRQLLVGNGLFVTGKQLVHDAESHWLYWCDREGMRVFRAREDGSDITVLVQAGLVPAQCRDYTRHFVGSAVVHRSGLSYWSLNGPANAG